MHNNKLMKKPKIPLYPMHIKGWQIYFLIKCSPKQNCIDKINIAITINTIPNKVVVESEKFPVSSAFYLHLNMQKVQKEQHLLLKPV